MMGISIQTRNQSLVAWCARLITCGLLLEGLAGATEVGDAGESTWTLVSPMNLPRELHTATLLKNGSVLVSGFESSNELYNPKEDEWTSGGTSVSRTQHTATLLTDGRVLVAGGVDRQAGYPVATAEVYDPSTNSWTVIEEMSTPRQSHTATLLDTGKVLVVGGVQQNGPPVAAASAELFDPQTNTWSPASSISAARFEHSATLLLTGEVLIFGGGTVNTVENTGELYDPVADSWKPAGTVVVGRARHAAALLADGRVLIAGGTSNTATVRDTCDLFDPSSNSWSAASPMHEVREMHTATRLANGRVLVTGGADGFSPYASAEEYDPKQDAWFTAGSMANARMAHTATLLATGKVLVAGGYAGDVLASAELYTSSDDGLCNEEGSSCDGAGADAGLDASVDSETSPASVDASVGNDDLTDASVENSDLTDASVGDDEHADASVGDDEHTDASVGDDEHTDASVGDDEHGRAVTNRERCSCTTPGASTQPWPSGAVVMILASVVGIRRRRPRRPSTLHRR